MILHGEKDAAMEDNAAAEARAAQLQDEVPFWGFWGIK